MNSSIVLAVFRNATINFYIELGYAHGVVKPIIGIFEPNDPFDIMMSDMKMDKVNVENVEAIQVYKNELLDKIRCFITNAISGI